MRMDMNSLPTLSIALWQGSDASGTNDLHLLMIFVGFIALAILLVAIVAAVIGYKALGVVSEVKDLVKDFHAKAAPIVTKSGVIIEDLTPKIRTVTENFTQMSYSVREKLDEVGETLSQVNRTAQEINRTVQATNEKTR